MGFETLDQLDHTMGFGNGLITVTQCHSSAPMG